MGFGKDGKGVIIRKRHFITLANLASQTVIFEGTPLVFGEDFRLIKAEFIIQSENSTTDESVMIGLADGDLTIVEIKESLEATGPVDRNENVQNERAMRPVWPICQVGNATRVPNDGLPIEQVFRWTFSDPEGWNIFAYNNSGSILTTGMLVPVLAKYYGVWVG